MHRNLRRAATSLYVVGSLMLGTAAGQQQQFDASQGQLDTRQLRSGNRGVARAANLQVPAGEGWQPGGGLPRGNARQPLVNQPGGPSAPQPRAPFTLTPQQEASLNQILMDWERQSSTIKTYKCEFERLEYGKPFDQTPLPKDTPLTDAMGELKYSAPDKGMFRLTSIRFYDTKLRDYKNGGPENLEHWVCDGKSIFEINHKEKTRTERRLPPEMQGAAISDGPLPFVFGAKADKLKSRYWMRDISPANSAEIWLEAYPRFQADAANFKLVEIIIGRKDFMPQAIKMYSPAFDPARGNESTTVFVFQKTSYNGALDNVFSDFVEPKVPFTYKKIVAQPAIEQPAARHAPPPRDGAGSARAPSGRSTR